MPPQPITYIGIDNGASGGIALIDPQGKVFTTKMPTTEQTLWETFKSLSDIKGKKVATIEQQIPRPTLLFDPRTEQRHSSILKSTCLLYAQYCQTTLALHATNIPFQRVVPETWQTEVGIPHKKQSRSDNKWKNVLKAHAQKLFPGVRVTLWNADALLIAFYCKLSHTPRIRRTKHF